MNKILFIPSAGTQGPHVGSGDLVSYLRSQLSNYEWEVPDMPDPEDPEYESWKERINVEVEGMRGNVILIGHSLGGSVILKSLSEGWRGVSLKGVFIVAAPFWGTGGWGDQDFRFTRDMNSLSWLPVFLYHSMDDEVVPVSHLDLFAKRMPFARIKILMEGGHCFTEGLPELVEDIQCLVMTK